MKIGAEKVRTNLTTGMMQIIWHQMASRMREFRIWNTLIDINSGVSILRNVYFTTHYANSKPIGCTVYVMYRWKFKSGGYYHWGKLAQYSGHGGEERLQKTAAETAQRIGELQTNLWITRATRAIFLDFTVYNANINLFCVVK